MSSPQRSFSLLHEPWIAVRLLDGSVQWWGLLDVFTKSRQVRALAETRPPVLVALYRLLLAITHRALVADVARWKDADRVRWFNEGLPADAVGGYLNTWRDRFWLFDAEHPFLQVAALATAPETCEKKKPWTQISLASANGNTPVVFDHALDQAPTAITPAEAVAHLLGFLQFTPGGLVKVLRDADKAGALVNTAAVIPVGEHLTQTLVLALHTAPLPEQAQHDLPAWERPPLTLAQLKAEPRLATGPNDRYTRQSRAVLLCAEGDSQMVRSVWFAAGEALGEDPQQPDPMACFREGSNGLVRVSFSEGRAVWRDLPALVPAPQGVGKAYKAAATIEAAAALNARLGRRKAHQPLLVAGLASDQAKLLRWRVEQFPLPPALLTDLDRAVALKASLALCEGLFGQVRQLATTLQAALLPDPASKDTRTRARDLVETSPLSTTYFAEAERGLWVLMEGIAQGDADGADQAWQRQLRRATLIAWQRLVDTLGRSADALRAEARCHRRLLYLLREQLPLTAPATPEPVFEGVSE